MSVRFALLVVLAPTLLAGCASGPGPDEQSSPTPTEAGEPEPTHAPQPRVQSDYMARYEGWVRTPTGQAPHRIVVQFPVNETAINASVRSEVRSRGLAPPPQETASMDMDLRAPSGRLIASGHRDVGNATNKIEFETRDLKELGNYMVDLRIFGGSDNATGGDRYYLDVFVKYPSVFR